MDADDTALIDLIYESAILFEKWPEVLRLTARLVSSRDALLGSIGEDDARFVVSSDSYRRHIEELMERFPLRSMERTRRLLESTHPGFLREIDVFEPGEVESDPVYQQVLLPQGYGAGAATAIATPLGDKIIIHCERPAAEGQFDEKAIARLDGLRPHFARSALLARQLGFEQARAATRALDLMGIPGAALALGGRVVSANSRFADLVPKVLQDLRSGVALVDPQANRMLRLALNRLSRADSADPVQSIAVPAAGDTPPLVVHLAPIRGEARDVFVGTAVLLFVTLIEPRPGLAPGIVQGLFDLTPAEARLAALIAAGYGPIGAAPRLGVTTETARTTLKRILAKVGVHRQAELVGLLQSAVYLPSGG